MGKFWTILSLGFLLLASMAQANERIFTYTYQSGVLGAGQREIEIWNTLRWQRNDFYRRLDHRMEYEIGLGANLQTALYLNLKTLSQLEGTPVPVLEKEVEFSFSNEWKYKLSDPVANAIGSALYLEIGIETNAIELEGKLIFDKEIASTTHALNLVAEPEWETEADAGGTSTEFILALEADYGFSYALDEQWNLGLELRNVNEVKDGDLVHAVLFGGPSASYTASGWWATLTVLPQLYAFKTEPGNRSNHLELQAHEKLETRLVFSFEL